MSAMAETGGRAAQSDVFLILAFSGGGTRAAALAYGVLETLAATELDARTGRRLLDEVDVISSVSGGSFTAAYYGLRGDAAFDDFDTRFLKLDVERDLARTLLRPGNWFRLASPTFARTDVAAEVYDRLLFRGATFADLWAADGPIIQIQGTDLVAGQHFDFTTQQFGLMCSDLATYPLARAVAASAAVPVVFSPITLRNYGGACAVPEPPWVASDLKAPIRSRRRRVAVQARSFRDSGVRPYVHLFDGGISDNLGLHGPLDAALVHGGWTGLMRLLGYQPQRRLAVIVVNAQTDPDPAWGQRETPPTLAQTLEGVTTVQIGRYNVETLTRLRDSLDTWRTEPGPASPKATYIVQVDFAGLRDADERNALAHLPTSLTLPPETVDRLRDAARDILLAQPEYRRLVEDLGGAPPPGE